MFAALHEGTSAIQNFSSAADPQSTIHCLRALGATIKKKGSEVEVQGVGRTGFEAPKDELDCGNSGTTMRLLSGIVGGAGIDCTLAGDASLNARTMKRIIGPLKKMGVSIEARQNDFAPLHFKRHQRVKALRFSLPIPSAQLKSCVLLAGLFGEDETEVIETIASRDHTERLLQLPVEESNDGKHIKSNIKCDIPPQNYRVPGDFSAAAYWLTAANIHRQANIELPAVGINPTRTGALDVLKKMGASISVAHKRMEGREPVADLSATSSSLKPVDITAEMVPNCIDEIPILMIAMLFAEGTSTIRGAEELRHKETDRLAAMEAILKVADAKFESFHDGFKIYGHPDFTPKQAIFNSEHDHRIAMAAAVLATMGKAPSRIKHAACTAISYPGFWDDLSLLTN